MKKLSEICDLRKSMIVPHGIFILTEKVEFDVSAVTGSGIIIPTMNSEENFECETNPPTVLRIISVGVDVADFKAGDIVIVGGQPRHNFKFLDKLYNVIIQEEILGTIDRDDSKNHTCQNVDGTND